MTDPESAKNRALGWIQLSALVTIAAAYAAGIYAPSHGIEHPIWIVLAAETVAILFLFLCSRVAGNSAFVDPHWSLAPIFIALYYAFVGTATPGHEPNLLRQMIVLPLVAAWGIRLTYNWMRGFSGFDHEDWRYAKLRGDFGGWYWAVELSGIHVFQMLLSVLGALALYPALAVGSGEIGILDGLALIVTLQAIYWEMTADRQLHAFIQRGPAAGEVLDDGLWKYSRHPNYYGEITFWWGLYLFGLAADPTWWWTIVGPLAMTSMFLFVSIPLIETRHLERRPGYEERARKVSLLVPWFPKA